ncbi:hypothetical protein H4S08_003410 [Coemansia sp. RSA 1365]|nr:hypothetical protein H4S08_003410 [Coemansia sp. RSA 1365]
MPVSYNVKYLKSLQAVRERSEEVYMRAQRGMLQHFVFSEDKLDEVADYVLSLVKRDFGNISNVPPHGRWRSYCVRTESGEVRDLISEHVTRWKANDVGHWECARRVVDLFMVSVLIDAGAGSKWRYIDELGTFERTEGLGIAALRMFENGVFSSSAHNPFQVDARALLKLTDKDIMDGFQVTQDNPLLACENRAQLLRSLGKALDEGPRYFGGHCACNLHPARPGFMLDYLSGCASDSPMTVSIDDLWDVIIDGLAQVWPASRTQLDGVSLGDVWPCEILALPLDSDGSSKQEPGTECLVPFHKLSQWLTWSLLEVIIDLGGFTVTETKKLTGLPEYRNGGLLVDMGVLELKDVDRKRGLTDATSTIPKFEVSDSVIIEWRAMTVVLLDRIADAIHQKCGLPDSQLPGMFLARVLEGGTWKCGREIAARMRGDTKDPPINIISDGTIF